MKYNRKVPFWKIPGTFGAILCLQPGHEFRCGACRRPKLARKQFGCLGELIKYNRKVPLWKIPGTFGAILCLQARHEFRCGACRRPKLARKQF